MFSNVRLLMRVIPFLLIPGEKPVFAQNLDEFYERRHKAYYASFNYTHFNHYSDSIPGTENYNYGYFVPSGGLLWEINSTNPGGFYFKWTNVLLHDLWSYGFIYIADQLKDRRPLHSDILLNGIFTHGIVGTLDMGWNVSANDRFVFTLGPAIGDYNYYFETIGSYGQQGEIQVPETGYYISAGPVLKADYALNDRVMLRLHSRLQIPVFSFRKHDDTFDPWFLMSNITLMTKGGLFIRGNMANMLRKSWVEEFGRQDVVLGYIFESG